MSTWSSQSASPKGFCRTVSSALPEDGRPGWASRMGSLQDQLPRVGRRPPCTPLFLGVRVSCACSRQGWVSFSVNAHEQSGEMCPAHP